MTYGLRISEELETLIRHLPPGLKRKIRSSLDEIRGRPEMGKPLTEDLVGLRSYKVGSFRIVYRQGNPIDIASIGPRKAIYQKLALEIKRRGASS